MNIRKLTPRLLKRIINEEKRKISNAPKTNKKKKKISEVKKLKLMRKKQLALLAEIKRLHLARKKIKKNLLKRL